jgi:hypothetical protein
MSNTGIPLQSAQNPAPQPDEDMLAMLGLHPAQMAVAHGLASGAIHPQQVLDAATPPPDAAASAPATPASPTSAPPPVLSGQPTTPRIASTAPAASAEPAATPGSTEDLESHALARSTGTPPIATPSPIEARTTTDQTKLAHDTSTGSGIQQFQQRHPILGGIARVGAGVGSALFPNIAAAIPGTDIHHQVVLNQDRKAVGEDLGEQQKTAQTGETEARTEQAEAAAAKDRADAAVAGQGKATKPEPIFDKAGNIVGFNTGTDLLSLNSPGLTPEMKTIAQAAKPKAAPSETQEQNKLAFQGVIGKLDAARLSTDPKTIDKSLDAALKQGVITPEEHAAARSYQAANPTPGTNLSVHIAGQEEGNQLAINKMFEGKEVLAHMPDGRRVQMSYADAKAQNIPPERLVALSGKEAQDTRDKAASVQTTFKGLDRYRTDFKNSAPNLTDKDRDALRVLAAHNQSGQTGGILAGFIDEIPLAGPMSSYANKLLEGTMTSDQYNQLSPAGKKMVSDYSTAIIDNFANMKAIMGTVGRNPQMIQAEVNTLPPPYLDWDSAAIQFENKRSSLQGRAASMPELYTPGAK